MVDVKQCQRCNRLWLDFAMLTALVARLTEAVGDSGACGDDCDVVVAGCLHTATVERAAAQTKLKIHLALTHRTGIGRNAFSAVTEYMPIGARAGAEPMWLSIA